MSAEDPKRVNVHEVLAKSSKLQDTFQVPFNRHWLTIARLRFPGVRFSKNKKFGDVISEVYLAGLGHFMYLTEDPILQKLGQLITKWWDLGKFVVDPLPSLHKYWKDTPRQKIDEDIPLFTWGPLWEGYPTEGIMVHVATPFVLFTQSHPVESLSIISQLGPMIYDAEQGIPGRAIRETQRSNAVQAHVLHMALQENPSYRLMPFAQRRLQEHTLDIGRLFPRL